MSNRQQRRANQFMDVLESSQSKSPAGRLEDAMAATAEPEAVTVAVALIKDPEGGFRLWRGALPASVLESYATTLSDPEIHAVQLGRAMELLEEAVRGDTGLDGRVTRPACPSCKAEAIVVHPSKPVRLCAACNARFPIEVAQ